MCGSIWFGGTMGKCGLIYRKCALTYSISVIGWLHLSVTQWKSEIAQLYVNTPYEIIIYVALIIILYKFMNEITTLLEI